MLTDKQFCAYVSLLILEVAGKLDHEQAGQAFRTLLDSDSDFLTRATVADIPDAHGPDWFRCAYALVQPPAWSSRKDDAKVPEHLHNRTIELLGGVSISGKSDDHLLALLVTEGNAALRDINIAIEDGSLATSLGVKSVGLIAPSRLEGTFVTGAVRALWLSHTGHRSDIFPERKIVSGRELRSALDPLTDQSYYFTAARCAPRAARSASAKSGSVGVSPNRARVWTNRSGSWKEFVEETRALLRRISPRPRRPDIPVLVKRAPKSARPKTAFDFSFQTPADDPVDPHDSDKASTADVLHHTIFDVTDAKGTNFNVSPYAGERDLCQLAIQTTLDGDRWKFTADRVADACSCGHPEWCEMVVRLTQGNRASARFESKHTVTNGTLVEAGFRDIIFSDWKHLNFTDFDPSKEKPVVRKFKGDLKPDGKTKYVRDCDVYEPTLIGKQDSLFCWVRKSQLAKKGLLICDDGTDEKADFIHIDLSAPSRAAVTLVHAKGSTGATNRGLAPSQFEQVCSQAVKNLRWLEHGNMLKGVEARLGRSSVRCWLDGNEIKSEAALKILRTSGTEFAQRKVLLLQPQVTSARLERSITKQASGTEQVDLLTLSTLLHSTKSACGALGAEFEVAVDNPKAPSF